MNHTRYFTANLAQPINFSPGIRQLRSIILFFEGHPITVEDLLRFIFNRAEVLRVLDLNWSDSCAHLYESIPQEIKKPIHLRLLNLSFSSRLRTLPESLCELLNLQSLNLKGCESLEKLPDGMGNLISLRFLRTSGCCSLTCYPKGIGRLTNLKDVYEISARADRNDPKEFSLWGLENMDNLCTVWMKLKGNAIDMGEATRARFENKTQLRDFRVYLDGDLDEDEVIQAFNLPSSINVHFSNANFEYK
ncbi:hypothetical protein SLEP1_g42330 [Rubroshorea leprosula]|uniref:Disease resistance R13L4/SHOC-2-like LRR domain-containing protein n=1 Tax=Rubroshorea leprosula TaxID=152421 RepID=A0AAV5L9V3_9ROSI|nr:hypothetical protein SLEP1_g42330 [Rubroshorea leprosula]